MRFLQSCRRFHVKRSRQYLDSHSLCSLAIGLAHMSRHRLTRTPNDRVEFAAYMGGNIEWYVCTNYPLHCIINKLI
jgi:hypothetical protein